ncbi:hypothetical protein SDC9_171912 [bioreactor metagenome]|uniref:Imelysin-like domain-containing protein n=1 Tax=bioreactor metagenome TaxID=1076179 RepID=A0A645GLB1_9ZZZZ
MKKLLVLMLTLVLALSVLAGCSSAPDLTGVTQKFNEVSDRFNEAAVLVEKNGWSTDEEMLKTHNSIADTLNEIKAAIEDPEQSKNIDVDKLTANLDEMLPMIDEYIAAVSVPYPAALDLTALKGKYNEIADLHTKVADNAKANGWLANETLVASLNEIADTMEISRQILEDPTVLDGGDITQADVDEYTGLLDQFIPILTDAQAIVAVPAN